MWSPWPVGFTKRPAAPAARAVHRRNSPGSAGSAASRTSKESCGIRRLHTGHSRALPCPLGAPEGRSAHPALPVSAKQPISANHNRRFARCTLCHPCHHPVDITIFSSNAAAIFHFLLAHSSKCTYRYPRVTRRGVSRLLLRRTGPHPPEWDGEPVRIAAADRDPSDRSPEGPAFGPGLSEGSPKELRRKTEGRPKDGPRSEQQPGRRILRP